MSSPNWFTMYQDPLKIGSHAPSIAMQPMMAESLNILFMIEGLKAVIIVMIISDKFCHRLE